MAKFIQNDIQFVADNSSLLQDGQRFCKFGNINNGTFSDAATDGVEPFVNAVEIDWNSANLSNLNETINTTGESCCSMIVPSIAA